jgi:hypothetical protein
MIAHINVFVNKEAIQQTTVKNRYNPNSYLLYTRISNPPIYREDASAFGNIRLVKPTLHNPGTIDCTEFILRRIIFEKYHGR